MRIYMALGLLLCTPLTASAQYVRSYDFSTGLLPQDQGWGLESYSPLDYTMGSSDRPVTFEEGGMRSDTMDLPFSGTGHQWWFEYAPYEPWPPCTIRDSIAWWDPYGLEFYASTGAYMEFEVRVLDSTYVDDGVSLRTGWNAWFGDFWQTFSVGLTDSGYVISNMLFMDVADSGGIRPLDTSVFHTYRLEADEAGGHLFIDGVYQETVPHGDAMPEEYGYAYGMFGDGQGLLDGVYSDTILRNFEYGCTPDNLAPLAVDDFVSGGGEVVIDVVANDTDVDGDSLVVVEASEPDFGTVTVDPSGLITYTPDPGYVGLDAFSYTVIDGHGGVDTAIVTIDVANFELDLVGTCPGWVEVNVSGLLPDEQFALVRADDFGGFVIPGGSCDGVDTGLSTPARWVGRLAFWGDDFGEWGAATLLSVSSCDAVWRAISMDSCRLSNLEQADL
jgi:hypothetical protein